LLDIQNSFDDTNGITIATPQRFYIKVAILYINRLNSFILFVVVDCCGGFLLLLDCNLLFMTFTPSAIIVVIVLYLVGWAFDEGLS
jgi:hypothetical protein